MMKLVFALWLPALLLLACAGGTSRYGCPVEEGHSCKSVSRVYAEAGRGVGERSFGKSPEDKKSAWEDKGRRFLKGGAFRMGKNTRGREEEKKVSKTEEAMPVYVPPPVIRLFIAPWQDARGVFHSGKYVYVVSGEGRWMIGEKAATLGGPPGDYPGELRLRGAGRAP